MNSYGAMRISTVSMKQGVIEAARIAKTYIALPKLLKYETGYTARDEQASFVWSDLNSVAKYLLQIPNK